MSTTTIRIDDTLRARLAAAADRSGKTAHAFIVDAIAQTVEQSEFDAELTRVAEERWGHLLASGKAVAWDEAKTYLEARSRGETPGKPKARVVKR